MSLTSLALFAALVFATAAPPGAVVMALIARVLAQGWPLAVLYAAAIWFGELVWMTAAVVGLTAIPADWAWVTDALRYAGAAYLLYLSWRMWQRDPQLGDPGSEQVLPTILGGIALALSSPEITIFYLAILPQLGLTVGGLTDWLMLAATLLVTLAAVDLTYVLLAARLRSLIRERPDLLRLTNRAGALVVATIALVIAFF